MYGKEYSGGEGCIRTLFCFSVDYIERYHEEMGCRIEIYKHHAAPPLPVFNGWIQSLECDI